MGQPRLFFGHYQPLTVTNSRVKEAPKSILPLTKSTAPLFEVYATEHSQLCVARPEIQPSSSPAPPPTLPPHLPTAPRLQVALRITRIHRYGVFHARQYRRRRWRAMAYVPSIPILGKPSVPDRSMISPRRPQTTPLESTAARPLDLYQWLSRTPRDTQAVRLYPRPMFS